MQSAEREKIYKALESHDRWLAGKKGEIISVRESGRNKAAVMALAQDRAILHDLRNDNAVSGLEEGKTATLVTDAEGYSSVPGRDAETRSQTRGAKR